MNDDQKEIRCSFCGKSGSEVRHFVTQGEVCICDACVAACADIMAEQDRREHNGEEPGELLTPQEIKARLSFLIDVGLDYLTLSRAAGTLSRDAGYRAFAGAGTGAGADARTGLRRHGAAGDGGFELVGGVRR